MNDQILLLSRRDEDAEFCAELARRMNFAFTPIPKLDHALSIPKNAKVAVFISVDDDKDLENYNESDVYKSLEALQYILPESRVFAIADKMIFELPHLFRNPTIGHYLLRKYDEFCFDWVEKLIRHGLQDVPKDVEKLKEADAKEVKIHLTHSNDRIKAIKGAEALLTGKGFSDRCTQRILQALDELILNAIFDAPMDEKGRTYRKANLRDSELFLFGKEEVDVSVRIEKSMILLTVVDQFGSFSKDRALKVIQKDYATAGYTPDLNTQSGGLGLHGIVGSGLGFLIQIIPGERTETVVAFPYFKSFKDMKASFRSFTMLIQDRIALKIRLNKT